MEKMIINYQNNRRLFTIRERNDNKITYYHVVTYIYSHSNWYPWSISSPLKNGRQYKTKIAAINACYKHMQSNGNYITKILLDKTINYHFNTEKCENYWKLALDGQYFKKHWLIIHKKLHILNL